jgi:hypothetical protein
MASHRGFRAAAGGAPKEGQESAVKNRMLVYSRERRRRRKWTKREQGSEAQVCTKAFLFVLASSRVGQAEKDKQTSRKGQTVGKGDVGENGPRGNKGQKHRYAQRLFFSYSQVEDSELHRASRQASAVRGYRLFCIFGSAGVSMLLTKLNVWNIDVLLHFRSIFPAFSSIYAWHVCSSFSIVFKGRSSFSLWF